jgi:uncharacterized membrane protein YedE/YeeE
MNLLVSGLISGVLFGFLLQKARVIRYDKQIGALRLIDMTIVKFVLSAVIVAIVGIHIIHLLGIAKPLILPTRLGANIIGGLIFGIGWGLLGYCPGTSLGALGEGRYDSLWGIIGMIAGAGLFAEAFPKMNQTIFSWGQMGSVTIPQVLGVNPWVVIIAMIIGVIALFVWFEKKNL